MPNRFLWIFFDSYIKSLGWARQEYSLEVAVWQRAGRTFAVLAFHPVLQDCMPASLHFVSAHSFSFFLTLPFNLCWSRRLHSRSIPELQQETSPLSLFPISVKWQWRELYAIRLKEIPTSNILSSFWFSPLPSAVKNFPCNHFTCVNFSSIGFKVKQNKSSLHWFHMESQR